MKHSSRMFLLILMLTVLIGGSLLTASLPASAALHVYEGELVSAIDPYEINADDSGKLWISDYDDTLTKNGKVWSVDALTREYKVYPVGGNPSDARSVGGYFYWADAESSFLGRATVEGVYEKWSVPSVKGFYGTAVDSIGNLWATDVADPYLYRLDPNGKTICTYNYANPDPQDYILIGYIAYQSGYIWFYDEDLITNEARLLRLRISDNRLEWWILPSYLTRYSSPFGIDIDEQDHLWFTDPGNKFISEFDPDNNKLSSYSIPRGSFPTMITIHDGLIWYTEQSLDAFGFLDPTLAEPIIYNLDFQSTSIDDPSCKSEFTPSETGTFQPSEGMIEPWVMQSYQAELEGDGWYIYNFSEVSANPYGIAFSGDKIWVVDNGRQLLVQAPLQASLRACKKFDFDNNLDTKADQVPLSGWGMTLYKEEAEIETLLTGSDGCVRWDGMELGVSYKVVEETRAHWEALAPIECNLGTVTKPGTYACDFYNWTQNYLFLPLVLR